MYSNLEQMRKCFQPRQWFKCDGEPYPFVMEEDALMWVYRPASNTLGKHFEVGYYMPDGSWFCDSAYEGDNAKLNAAARVRFLNGGN